MSKLKYKVGDTAGPFKILSTDQTIYPYFVKSFGRNNWMKQETVESVFDHYAKSELLEKKAESQRKTIAYWKDKHSNMQKYCMELTIEKRDLKESNVELRGANEELKTGIEKCLEVNNKAWELKHHVVSEELKTAKSHLELRTKGIQALEEDAKVNRVEIASLKSDFETKNSELEILEEDYNCLKDVQKYTKVVGWVGWIMFFIALFGLMFFKG